ncbi:MAG: glycoside hydrolase family 13 protein [Firmicutes bacterium]|nr:glycoside hydrolase family 13 protein [Bacillota bacterium]
MINIQALFHQPLSNYAFSIDENTLIFRLRTAKDDIDKVIFHFGDTAYQDNPIQYTSVQMALFAADEYFDYYEIMIKDSYKRIVYYFELCQKQNKVYYYGDHVYDEVSIERNDMYKLPYHRKEDIIDVPKWLKKAIIYNIFPDSFATSKNLISGTPSLKNHKGFTVKSKLGGAINGVTENLDYIQNLGFNTVYLNPIFAAGEYHKYDIIDYFSIDPCFGTNDDFLNLVNECHLRDMKIIIDGVFNHSGWNFFAFEDCVKNGEASVYKDWFYRLEFPVVKPETYDIKPGYECFGYERLMPKLNTSNKEVISYLMKVATYWTKEYHIDGWRLDVADEVDSEFWRIFRKTVKEINPEIAIIGEVWQSARYFLDGSMFDSTMNYVFLKYSKDFFANTKITATEFNTRIVSLLTRYHKNTNYGQLNLLDSHDTPRFLSHAEGNIQKYELALLFLFTFVGAPMLFYGDECGLEGLKEEDYRQKMRFESKHNLIKIIQSFTSLRNSNLALQLGDYRTVYTQEDGGFFVFKRFNEEEEIIIFLNVNEYEVTVEKEFNDCIVLIHKGYLNNTIQPYGYLVVKRKRS